MKIFKFKKINSTQKKAKELAEKITDFWIIVIAEEQTQGRGRKGDLWYSPLGGLYFSIILPKMKIEDVQSLNLLAAFVIAKILKKDFKLEPFIKLPNDILVNGKKICGILTENIIQGKEIKFSIMGIGLNTNIEKFPPDLKNKATSLKIELGKEIDNKKIFKKILKGLQNEFKVVTE